MKKSIKKMIGIAIGLFIVGTVTISVGAWIVKRQVNNTDSMYTYTYEISEITSITADCDSLNIRVAYVEGNELTIAWNEAIDPQCEIINSDGDLMIISRNELIWIDLLIPQLASNIYTLEIGIPADYLGSLSITTGSGEVTAKNISAEENICFSAGSGKLELNNISSGRDMTLAVSSGRLEANSIRSGGDIAIGAGSGRIEANQITLNGKFSAKGSSGEIDINDLNGATTVDISATSGNISYSGINADEITAETGSGKIRFDSIFAEKSIHLKAGSGDIDGTIRDSVDNYTISTSTFSGKNNLPANISIGGKTLEVKTGSGDIDIIFIN